MTDLERLRPQVGDEMTLKELFQFIGRFIAYAQRRWRLIAVIAVSGGLVGGVVTFMSSGHYTSKIEFVVEDYGSANASLNNVLRSMGSGTQTGTNPYKVLEVARGSVIFDRVMNTSNGDRRLGYQLIDDEGLLVKWRKDFKSLKGVGLSRMSVLYPPVSEADLLIRRLLYREVVGKEANGAGGLIAISYDEDSAIFSLGGSSSSDETAQSLTDSYYEELKTFFEEDLRSTNKKTLKLVSNKVDSLKELREHLTTRIAYIQQTERASFSPTKTTKVELLSLEKAAVNGAYSRILADKEATDILNRTTKDVFIKLNQTLPPLILINKRYTTWIPIGIVAGVIIAGIWLLTQFTYEQIMGREAA